MLYLNARFNRAFRDLLRPSYTYWNNNIVGYQNRINGNYVRRLNIDQAMMPYAVSSIEIENSTYINTHHLKERLIKEGKKENKCECCGLST